MSQPRDDRQDDLFSPALAEIINLRHPLVGLAEEIDWGFLAGRFGSVCRAGPGQPPLPTRLVAGLFILKHMHNFSDEVLCERWVENPYFQYFCGEVVFRHESPFDRSSLTRWRQRLGEEQIIALLQESLSVAHRRGAIETKDLERVVVDTTVQEKAIAHPTDARLIHRAIEKLVDLAKREGVELRQSYRAWPNARPSWWGAIRMRTSSSAPGGNSNSCARDSAASSATFAAKSRAMPHGKIALVRCSILRCGFAIKSSVNADQRSIRYTPPKWSALAAARHGLRTNSVARSRLPCQSPHPEVDSSCCMPRRCMATPMTATRSAQSSPTSKSSQVLMSAASTATRAIAVTAIPTGSRSGLAARSAASPKSFAAKCAAELPSSP